jgi:formyltetrahydrofolate synthetase
LEGGPALIHAGPFANIAHGNSSVVADRIALKVLDAVCTEAGFGSDMGFQKFIDIKCRLSGLRPAAAVIVATIRALKMHGGVGHVVAGKPLDPALGEENVEGVRKGCQNLVQHIEIVRGYGVPAVVAINSFPSDRQSEVDVVRSAALAAGADECVVTDHFSRGGAGAEELARAVWAAASDGAPHFRFLSREDATLEQRIERIAMRVYGADGVDYSGEARKSLHEFERLGYGHLPVCMAKTALSLSHDPNLKGRPTGFRVPIRDARLFAGAGFVTAYCGDMLMMPGLPSRPSGEDVDINEAGETIGLF